MEGVEDIPGAALSEGIQWGWETFPEYLDAVDQVPKSLDVGSQIPHGAVRAYVMGERGAKNEPATAEDIEAMAAIVRDAIAAGALGVSTSRTIAHMAIDGEPVPGTFAAEDELFGIGRALADAGGGIFELAPAGALGEDLAAPDQRDGLDAAAVGRDRPSGELRPHPERPRPRQLATHARARGRGRAEGARVRPQVAGRPVTLLLGLETFHPFAYTRSWAEIGLLPLAGQGGEAPGRPRAAGPVGPRGVDARPRDAAVPRPGEGLPARRPARLRARHRRTASPPAPRPPAGTPTSSTSTCCWSRTAARS